MRTDVVFDTERRLKNPCPMVGSPDTLGRGDWIEWEMSSGSTDRGRIIGIVKPNDECQEYFCVAWHIRSGGISERWILPKYVTAGFRGRDVSLFLEKVNWLYSDDFLKTPPEIARQVWDLEYKDLVKGIE